MPWRLPFAWTIALRYLKSTRKDAFVTFLSSVAAGGLALGVAALILSIAALSGFQKHLIGEVLEKSVQIEVELPGDAPDLARQKERVAAVEGVRGVQGVSRGQGWILISGRGIQPVELVGFDGSVPASFAGAAGGAEGFYLSSRLAARWSLDLGDTVDLASPRPTLAPFGGPQPRLRSVVIAGFYDGGPIRGELDRVALPLAVAESLLGGSARRLEVDAGGFEAADGVARRLASELPAGSEVRTWRELNGALFFVLRLEKLLMFVAVFLIVVVAAFALVADLALIISNKRPEIGILSAMGATPRALRRVFLLLGIALSGIGATAGTVLGIGGAWILDRFELLRVPGGALFLSHVPFEIRPRDLAVILGCTLLMALAASLFAASRAAGIEARGALGP